METGGEPRAGLRPTREPDFSRGNGLLPAVVQDNRTNEVLMVGYMNAESYRRTLAEGRCWFYSRSRQTLWMKGETSGNVLRVRSIAVDCDADTLLVRVEAAGPACHQGTVSCFEQEYFEIGTLEETVEQRFAHPREGSYTQYLVSEGLDKILKKFGEESTEVILAAKNQNRAELVNETADVLYHLLVLLRYQGVDLAAIYAELANRHGTKQQFQKRRDITQW
ncbi:phosphoribosyl-ATP pyrophosphatase [Actinobaculum suis]|nr:phosphoribosyl-ATP pyrophosphatase [Actinobaculum suis]